jgi:ABC-2 type transport system ATP-binding protein
MGPMIEARAVTKTFGRCVAVDRLTFAVQPGRVTGFLGPNGAGKTTTMRMILGLDRPSAGSVTVAGKRYTELPAPLREVGASLDARAVHDKRRAYDHLLWLARCSRIPRQRVAAVIDQVGLTDVAGRRVGTFSLGMSQRLGLAAALLGDPPVLLFDEPVNGLDPEGIRWVRQLMRQLAGEGRTVLVSSHMLSEMAQTADHLIVIGRGRLIADTRTNDFLHGAADQQATLVRVLHGAEELVRHLRRAGASVERQPDGRLIVSGLTSDRIGTLAADSLAVLAELIPQQRSLEQAFMERTRDDVEYRAGHADR